MAAQIQEISRLFSQMDLIFGLISVLNISSSLQRNNIRRAQLSACAD